MELSMQLPGTSFKAVTCFCAGECFLRCRGDYVGLVACPAWPNGTIHRHVGRGSRHTDSSLCSQGKFNMEKACSRGRGRKHQ